jgi:hypothetical protein
MNSHEGWSNYQTWAVALWINNDHGMYDYWTERAQQSATLADLADALKDEHIEFMPEVRGAYSDLLTWALGMVDWYEIATDLWDSRSEEGATQ